MGYIHFETFADSSVWQKSNNGPTTYALLQNDWPSLFSTPTKSQSMVMEFLDPAVFSEAYLERTYRQPYYFSFKDEFGIPFNYSDLIFTYSLRTFGNPISLNYNSFDNFFLSLGLYDDDRLLREWFLPVQYASCGYHYIMLDMSPLIALGHTKFNRVRLNVIKKPEPYSKLYFGDLSLFDDSLEHNISVTLAQQLHGVCRKRLTQLFSIGNPGDKHIRVTSGVDLKEHSPILIGEPEGQHELHVIKSVSPESSKGNEIEFDGNYDGEVLREQWGTDAPVWLFVPATNETIEHSSAVYPVFYIETGMASNVEQLTPMGWEISSYVRDETNGHTYAYHKARMMKRLPITIHIYANTVELATEMRKKLYGILDNQTYFYIGGVPFEYEFVNERDLYAEIDSTEDSPYFLIELACYFPENNYAFEYHKFTRIKSLSFDLVGLNKTGIPSGLTGTIQHP